MLTDLVFRIQGQYADSSELFFFYFNWFYKSERYGSLIYILLKVNVITYST